MAKKEYALAEKASALRRWLGTHWAYSPRANHPLEGWL